MMFLYKLKHIYSYLYRKQFGRLEELYRQDKKVGDVAVLKDGGRFIYYLVTKRFSVVRTFYSDLEEALFAMKIHMVLQQCKILYVLVIYYINMYL